MGILSPGSAGGTAGNDEIQVTLAAGQNATDYNFAILGAQGNDPSVPTAALDASPLVSSAAAAAAPSGYTITADQSTIDAGQATSTGFTFAGATTGTTYNYTVTSSGGGTAVSGSGSVTSATQNITGINVSSLPDGTLTYSVTLTLGGSTGVSGHGHGHARRARPQRLYDHGRPGHGQCQPGDFDRLHLCRRHDGHDLQLHGHQQRRQPAR